MDMTVDKHDGNAASDVRPQDIIIVHDPCVAASTGRIYRYQSVASMPGAKLETSFGVDSAEPHTHVYPLPGHRDSSQSYCGEQRTMSLIDVNRVTPAPENTLGDHVCRDSVASVASSAHSGKCVRASDVQCRDADGHMLRAGKLQPNLLNPAYRYERPDVPPPYKPPPSYYTSQYTMESGEVVRPRCLNRNLAESFRQAIESSRSATPSTTKHALKRSTSSPSKSIRKSFTVSMLHFGYMCDVYFI